MKTRNILKLLIVIISLTTLGFTSCKQKDNPKYLGKEYGKFDLAQLTFKEDFDMLFSKIDNAHFYASDKRTLQIYRANHPITGSDLYSFYGLDLNMTTFYLKDSDKSLLAVTDLLFLSSQKADDFINKVKNSNNYQEIKTEKDERIDNYFIGVNHNSMLEITKTLFNVNKPDGECQLIVQIYQYPQNPELIRGSLITDLKTIEILKNSVKK